MAFWDKVAGILSGGFVEKILDKIPDAGQKAAASLEIQKELNRATEEIVKAQLEETKAYLKDTADARALQAVALTQSDPFAKRFLYFLTGYLVIITTIYLFMVSFCDIPKGNEQIIYTILGFLLGSVLGAILAFFYGSTKSSNDKTDQIIRLAGTGGSQSIPTATVKTEGHSETILENKQITPPAK